MFHESGWVPFLHILKMEIMWSLSCDANITEEAGSSLYEWLNIYKNWVAAVKNKTACDNLWLRRTELASLASYNKLTWFYSKHLVTVVILVMQIILY